ncbi:CHAT domain-containing protein [Sphingomonas sp. LB-2]|uniref:CHAT domain-containing protein n=1 Tax=Sphingomonas caeni TaxID=2984949 RepID=UPI0022304E93|nr:CHAT domain-containing protein [Sphingomonas caeni]MCW3847368.1 CHAT domain-containing protein [Sphingomonas caeni]
MTPFTEIIYAFAIPSWDPRHVTPFQGFAPGLVSAAALLPIIVDLPSDILELTMEPLDRLARRRAGAGSLFWSPVNIETLIRYRKPTPQQPFLVVISAEAEIARRVAAWRRNLRLRPLHISATQIGGAIPPNELTVERLQTYCRNALRQARQISRHLDIADHAAAIEAWQPTEERPTSLRLHSHNVVVPNQMVLMAAGETPASGEDGHLNVSPQDDYIDGITESAQAVLNLQGEIGGRVANLLNPPQPDVTLLAPAMFPEVLSTLSAGPFPPGAKKALRALDRQRRYTMEIPMEEGEIDEIGPFLSMRGAELKLQSMAVGLRTASTISATIRLPPVLNRTAGVVGQLARHLRHYDDPPDIKTARVFKAVQDALLDAVPPAHLDLIKQSETGIKIIGNAPLEWLPVDGLPLGIRSDVSRINATPGNVLIEQLRSMPPLYIPPEQFKSYLVVSMFEADDNIAHFVRRSLEILPDAEGGQITGTHVAARTVDEFVAAVNAYTGPILIVDSHGTHPNNPNIGGLVIGGDVVNAWDLKDRLTAPPIVVLSACDTHPFDRSHATAANGFLACGARAVLATVLPIGARDGAVFLNRLMRRAITFGDIMNRMGRSAPWTNIVGGALRMQLASDIVRGLVARDLLPADQANDVQLQANMDINTPRPDWLDRLAERCQDVGGFEAARWQATYSDILAASDVIRYVNLGNPESILIADERVVQRAMEQADAA